jgi:HD-like signal output (HDOD) protein
MKEAVEEHTQVAEIEQRVMGFTHAESGRVLAELWRLPAEISEVIELHHQPEEQDSNNAITIVVHAANQLCWASGLGYYPVPDYAHLCATKRGKRLLRRSVSRIALRSKSTRRGWSRT